MVKLLRRITAVEIQKETGMVNISQFPWAFRTIKALVQPANIIQILAIAIHISNLCGWIFCLCALMVFIFGQLRVFEPEVGQI
jgi:hypothetical protein